MKTRITNDQYIALKERRSAEFLQEDTVSIVQRTTSTSDPNYCICTIQHGVVTDTIGTSKFIIEVDNSPIVIDLNRGLSRWEFSKNYKYETFLIHR